MARMTETATPPAPGSPADVARVWDARADRYLALFRHELEEKPFDRAALEAFAARVGQGGRACDAGCGPCGHVTALLAARGLDLLGIDLSPRCVALARAEHPALRFEVMDLRALDLPGGALDGLVAYYALHDQPKAGLAVAFAEWARVLRPGGQLLVVAKEGAGEGPIPDPLGSDLTVFWAAFAPDELRAPIEAAGFRIDGCTSRAPQAGEIAARRIYVTATRR
jgi:SAM-dependent methyltransferase